MQLSRYINLSFVTAGFILWVILWKATGLALDTAGVANTYLLGQELQLSHVIAIVLAMGATVFAWRHPDIKQWSNEVAIELSKVTWPGWEETKHHTLVVIIFALVISAIIASFDFFWKWVTDLILVG